jgi:mediator of RNA polymerase II transcription subunit 14
MAQGRVAILDASNTFFPDGTSLSAPIAHESDLALKPILDFRSIIAAACMEAASIVPRSKMAPIDVGVVCHSSAVRAVARALHQHVLRRLKNGTVKVEPM